MRDSFIALPALAALLVVGALPPSADAQEATPDAPALRAAASSTDWLLPHHDYASSGHTPLTLIDPANVASLRVACTYAFEDSSRFAGVPLVERGVLYLTSGDTTVALDAATCALRWRNEGGSLAADTPGRRVGNAFRSAGVALASGRLLRATSDGRLLALDAHSGRLLWARPVANAARHEFVIMAPLAVDDLVIAGIGISEYAVRGWIGAYRLADGEPVWRFSTVPDEGEPGAETWSDAQARQRGGGGVWNTPGYDAGSGLLYVAVGNPVPDLYGDVREGDNLYTNSLVVLDARSGALRWHRQLVPHDVHDWDVTVAGPLYAAPTGQSMRPVVATGGKDGVLRAIDCETHEERFAVSVTTRSNAQSVPTAQGVHACPGILGGMQWSPPAHDPRLNLLIAPAVDWCGSYRKAEALRYAPGQLYLGGSFSFDEDSGGWLSAIDAVTGSVRWKYRASRPLLANVVSTASGLVFTADLDGHFLALDAHDGAVLHRLDIGAPAAAGVISYAVEGKQYVAVATGTLTSFWGAPATTSRLTILALP